MPKKLNYETDADALERHLSVQENGRYQGMDDEAAQALRRPCR